MNYELGKKKIFRTCYIFKKLSISLRLKMQIFQTGIKLFVNNYKTYLKS